MFGETAHISATNTISIIAFVIWYTFSAALEVEKSVLGSYLKIKLIKINLYNI